MARIANHFIDAKPGGLGDYPWPVNHSDEEEGGRRRRIERTANTAGVGAVRQQGDAGPLLLRYRGTILNESQHAKFAAFFKACEDRTVIFRDFHGDQYEVLIVAYLPVRVRAMRNLRDPAIPLHIYTYSLEMEVVNVLARVDGTQNVWAGVA